MNDLYIKLVEQFMEDGYTYEEAGNKAMEELPALYADMVDAAHDRWSERRFEGKPT